MKQLRGKPKIRIMKITKKEMMGRIEELNIRKHGRRKKKAKTKLKRK